MAGASIILVITLAFYASLAVEEESSVKETFADVQSKHVGELIDEKVVELKDGKQSKINIQ